MLFHDALNDCQPQPGTVVFTGEERVEDVFEVFGRNAATRIGYFDDKYGGVLKLVETL